MKTRDVLSRRIPTRWFSATAVGLLLTVGAVSLGAEKEDADVRWDIISVVPPNVTAGGMASARANDNSRITLTGRGTFEASSDSGDVTGGGAWMTCNPANVCTNGTYRVTRLVRFEVAPGTPIPGLIDHIGNVADQHAGLAVLSIRYSDGSRGILVVSCHVIGTSDSVFEGVTASKGFVDYWNREAPMAGADANRTLFHVSKEED